MKEFPLFGKDADPKGPINTILHLAFGIPERLDAAPTTSNGLLPKNGDNGIYSNTWYFNFHGNLYTIALTNLGAIS